MCSPAPESARSNHPATLAETRAAAATSASRGATGLRAESPLPANCSERLGHAPSSRVSAISRHRAHGVRPGTITCETHTPTPSHTTSTCGTPAQHAVRDQRGIGGAGADDHDERLPAPADAHGDAVIGKRCRGGARARAAGRECECARRAPPRAAQRRAARRRIRPRAERPQFPSLSRRSRGPRPREPAQAHREPAMPPPRVRIETTRAKRRACAGGTRLPPSSDATNSRSARLSAGITTGDASPTWMSIAPASPGRASTGQWGGNRMLPPCQPERCEPRFSTGWRSAAWRETTKRPPSREGGWPL